jgi:hypothetical protein
MKIKILEAFVWNGSVWLAGSEHEFPADVAERLIAEGKAKAIEAEAAKPSKSK